jgi:hypothetical protein
MTVRMADEDRQYFQVNISDLSNYEIKKKKPKSILEKRAAKHS